MVALSQRLRELVALESETREPNGQGGFVTAWNAVGPGIYAEIIGLTGDESINIAVERSVQRWRVTMRKRPTPVTTKHRLNWGGVILEVKSSVPDPKLPGDAIVLLCESRG